MWGTIIPALAALGTFYSFSFPLVCAAPAPAPVPIAQLSTPLPFSGSDVATTARLKSTTKPGTTAPNRNATIPVVVHPPTTSTPSTRQTSLTSSVTGSTALPPSAISSQSLTGHPTTSSGSTFVAPLSTATHSITEPSQTPTGALYYATNPANPQQTAAFGSTTLPPSERNGLPDATDAAPLALLLAGFAGVSLLFGDGLLVFPLIPSGFAAIPAWLTLSLFPAPGMLPGKGPSKPNNPTNKPSPSSTKSSSATSSTSSSSTTSSTTHPHYTATQTQDINYTLKKQAHAPFVSFGIIEPTAFSGGYLVFPADPSSATTAPAHSTTPTGSVSLTTSSATTRGSTSPATTTKSSAAQTTSSTTTTKSSTSSKTSSTVTIIPTRPADPIDKPTCQANVVNSAPPKLMINGAKADLDGLLFMLREVICSDKCVVPAGLDASVVRTTSSSGNGPDCEIAVALPYSIEAYATRNSHSQGDQWQECWDSTQNIINTCIKNGPNAGWWSGKYENQFYQLGVRPLNGQGNKHTDKPLDPSKHLTQAPSTGIGPVIPPPPPPPPPTPSQTGCNNHGSGLCPEVKSFGACVIAFGRYSDDYIYKSFTSYTVTIVGQLVDPGNFLGFGYPGCAAMFGCDNAQAYAVGMSGKQIKNAYVNPIPVLVSWANKHRIKTSRFQNIYDHCGVNACGSAYLSNNCHVTVNACRDCRNAIPSDAPIH